MGTNTAWKRDQYSALVGRLSNAISTHDQKVSQANEVYQSYTHSVPNLSNSKIPSNDFYVKRGELDGKLTKYFSNDEQKRGSLFSAKNIAYQKYIYYRDLAIKEEEERREQEEQARREQEVQARKKSMK